MEWLKWCGMEYNSGYLGKTSIWSDCGGNVLLFGKRILQQVVFTD
jgi:hypothetical protein